MQFEGRTICLVAGMHGNEKSPVRALRESGIDFILGNPEAHEINVRFVEKDLNASFGISGDEIETKRARGILDLIPKENLVVDFHTTSAQTPPFVILVDAQQFSFAEITGLQHAVLMKHNIKKGGALINHRDGISIEMEGHDSQESYQTTLEVLKNLREQKRTPIKKYEVYDIITEPGEYENFVPHPLGFIPILVGEKSYDIIGLKAKCIN